MIRRVEAVLRAGAPQLNDAAIAVLAKAVINEMRVPTSAMCFVGVVAATMKCEDHYASVQLVWQSMMDEAAMP